MGAAPRPGRTSARARNVRDGCGSGRIEKCLPRGVQPNLAVHLGGRHLPRIAKAKFETTQTDPQRFCHLANRDRRSPCAHQVLGFPNRAWGGRGSLFLQNVREVVRMRLKNQGGEKLLEVLPSMRCERKLLAVAT